MLVAGKTEHLNRQRFNGAQQFPGALQDQRGIGPRKFDQNLRPFPIAPLGKRRIDGYAVFEMETAVRNDTAQERVDFLCGCDFVWNRHELALSTQLSAPSFQPALAES